MEIDDDSHESEDSDLLFKELGKASKNVTFMQNFE